MLFIFIIFVFISSSTSFIKNSNFKLKNHQLYQTDKQEENDVALTESMRKARICESNGLSPGAGLATADEQSDAAYADLINTSIDQRQISELSEDDLKQLERGGKMWEKGSISTTKKGFFGDALELFKALSGGAHIEKNKFGET